MTALTPARARAQYDPGLQWFTLTSPHGRLYFHAGEEALAQRAARAAEVSAARLRGPMRHETPLTEFVLVDNTDDANGSTSTFIYPQVVLYAAPPTSDDELNDYDDYLFQLVAHEYTHVLHLDTVTGLNRAFNLVFGQQLVPNGVQPRWVTEGYAVFFETEVSTAGRLRSSLYQAWLRAQLLTGGRLLRLDEVSSGPTRWPYGSAAYLYGSHFISFIAARHGEEALGEYSLQYADQVLPYALNSAAQQAMAEGFVEQYALFEAALKARLEGELEQIRAQPVTPLRLLTHAGNDTGEPRFAPDGQSIYYLEASGDRRRQLRRRGSHGGDALVAELQGGGEFDVDPSGTFAIVSEPEVFHEWNNYRDLFRVDLKSGASEQLTHGLRAQAPDLSPDGKRVACVVYDAPMHTSIAVVTLADLSVQIVYRSADGDQAFTPRWSPDGAQLVFSEHRGRFRDLFLLTVASEGVQQLTFDQAIDVDPTFDRTGRWVVFASDRTGVYDLFALSLDGLETRLLVHTETAAFHPELSPDGKWVAFATLTGKGSDVALAAIPGPFDDLPPAPASRADRGPGAYVDGAETYPVEPYSPWRTLRPRYWLPTYGADGAGRALGFQTSGEDVLGRHAWALSTYWSLAGGELGGSASYTNHTLYPYLTLNADRELLGASGAPAGSLERQTALSGGVQVPLHFQDRAFSFGLTYEQRAFTPLWTPRYRPDSRLPAQPVKGRAATASASLGYSSVRGFAEAISPEEGVRGGVTARWASRALGGDFDYATVQASAATYVRLPWALHQVLALRLQGGIGAGELGGRHLFGLGGPTLTTFVGDVLAGGSTNNTLLRGYAPGSRVGDRYALGTAEYRLPLTVLDRGLWTVPLFLRRVHVALFTDVGLVGREWSQKLLAPSVGAEALVDLTAAYFIGTTARLGFARGLAADGVNDAYLLVGAPF